MMTFENTLEFARSLDEQDTLKDFRQQFYIPQVDGKDAIYLCGNSLGLQPKTVEDHLKVELEDWRNLGVEGHLHGKNPWLYYHHFFSESIGRLVGADKSEVVVMNQLTVNLNLMLISFYRPEGKRNKILVESNEFPSDYYAIEQQIRLHGLNPEDCIVEVMPRAGEGTLRTEDIISKIEEHKDELALVMLSVVNYYTGQLFEIPKIAAVCATHNITIGLDLAHAIGNVELQLHNWGIDFATWCSYKYLNSGPGGVSGVFVNERHANNPALPRLAGWWGNDEKTRFKMQKNFVPQTGAAGWQISNAPILSMAAHKASLEIFDKATLPALRKKSELLTSYLYWLLTDGGQRTTDDGEYKIITPAVKEHRGCQLSIQTKANGKALFEKITKAGVIADWREPDVIRVAPVPLYNTFEDVWRFASLI
ncbi:MAG TPA: kynureninase [Chitinophagales bacterium]|nr:kynureninase [Chitinophagales bacterium]